MAVLLAGNLSSSLSNDGERHRRRGKLLRPFSETDLSMNGNDDDRRVRKINRPHRRNWDNFLFTTSSNDATSVEMTTTDTRNNFCVIRNEDFKQTFLPSSTICSSMTHRKNCSVVTTNNNNNHRPNLPLFCLFIVVFSSFLPYIDGAVIQPLEQATQTPFRPINITFKPPGSQNKRFFQSGNTGSKLQVAIVLNISEATPVGTPISYLITFDKKPNDLVGTNYTFVITHESDVYRQFSIGNQDGALRVAKPLDRETIPSYRLVVKAIDESGSEGYIIINVNLGDENDNAPYLNLTQRYIIWENDPPAFIGTVTAFDPDGPGNGPPFYMQQAQNSSYFDLINVVFDQMADKGNGAINVSSKKTLDREGDQGKFLYVPIYVQDAKSLSAIRYLPIEIGDRNDNPMTDGSSTINIYNYKGEMPDTIIGRVYVTDLDDWDIVDKTFTFKSGPQQYFSVASDGLIALKQGTPEGTYTLSVNVVDNVRHENAVGTVTIRIVYIDDNAIRNSGSVRIRGVSAETFLRPYPGTNSAYEHLRESLAKYLNVDQKNVQIFSILPLQPADQYPPVIDVYFAITTGNDEYLSPILLTGTIEQKRLEIEANFGLSNVQIIQVNIDPCIQEMCTEGGCTRLMNVNATPSVIMANQTSLVGVNLNVTASCQCPIDYVTPKCTADSCYNGGICHNADTGYFCECRGSYNNGSRCQGRTRGFNSGGYAWLKPIGSCNNFSISLEFMTKSTNATLLFNGPMQNGRPNDVFIPDFIAILVVNARLVVQVNLGGGTTTFQFNSTLTPTVNDGEWHVVDIIASQRDFEIILDRCKSITVQGNVNNKRALQACRVAGVASGSNEQLNVDDPLQIGGVAGVDGTPFNQTLVRDSLVGCLRNLIINGELYDLHGVPNTQNSNVGCALTEQYCEKNGAPLCIHGECVASLSGKMRCVCDVGWYGEYCDTEAQWKTFGQKSYVQYNLAGSLPQTYNRIQILFVPTQINQGYLTYTGIYPPQGSQTYLGVDLTSGYLGFDYNFGSGPFTIRPEVRVQGSKYSYLVEVDRYWTYSRISIDGLSDPYAAFRVGTPDESGWMIYNSSLNFFLGAANANAGSDDFQGCIKEFTFNDMYIPVADSNIYASVVGQNGVTDGCATFLTCASGLVTCSSPFVCMDFWKGAFCTCPQNVAPILNSDGTVAACGSSVASLHLGITRGAIAAILVSLLALILLVLLLVVWSCRNRHKPPPDETLIAGGNVLPYNEEGGGEEDQHRYNIGPLRKPVIPTQNEPLQGHGDTSIVIVKPPTKPKTPLKPSDLDAFIRDRVADLEHDPSGPPYDELRVYAVEFDGVSVCSLSSLESAGSDIDWDGLDEWGPRFRNLATMYGGGVDD